MFPDTNFCLSSRPSLPSSFNPNAPPGTGFGPGQNHPPFAHQTHPPTFGGNPNSNDPNNHNPQSGPSSQQTQNHPPGAGPGPGPGSSFPNQPATINPPLPGRPLALGLVNPSNPLGSSTIGGNGPTSGVFPHPIHTLTPSGSGIGSAPAPHPPAVGYGQGLIRLLQFSGNLASESRQKHQLSWWNELIREYFTPRAIMRFTLWKDNLRSEAKPFGELCRVFRGVAR